MNQIPREGEYCGDCPCLVSVNQYCKRHRLRVKYAPAIFYGIRLPECIEQVPQILTEKERLNIQCLKELCQDWYSEKLNDMEVKMILKMIVDPEPVTEECRKWAIKTGVSI